MYSFAGHPLVWETITQDKIIIHLFAKFTDGVMAKIFLEIVSFQNLTVQELRMRVARTELALWYSQWSFQDKPVNQKFCKDCNSDP